MEQRYYSLNTYCKETFGQKIYRLSINGGMTCPNRDGKLSTYGCYFCSEGGSGDFASNSSLSITAQLEQAKEKISAKANCHKFIAYFQAYTNTYAPIDYLEKIFTEAINHPDVIVLSIATRSDCLSDEVIELLSKLNKIKPVWVEIGLQTIHNITLQEMNTHTTVQMFDDVTKKLQNTGMKVIAHLILGFPNETKEMIFESVKHLSSLNIWGVKLQLLHVLKNTKLADIYSKKPFPIMELDEYCQLIVNCLELLPKKTVIHRITGDGPRKILIAPLWSTDKKRVLNTINKKLKEENTYQGRLVK